MCQAEYETLEHPKPLMVNQDPVPIAKDDCSWSNFAEVQTRHLALDWIIDWDEHLVKGSVVHSMEAVAKAHKIVFDVSFIDIAGATVSTSTDPSQVIGTSKGGSFGRNEKFEIKLDSALKRGDFVKVTIDYTTTKSCTALGWLKPEQTGSGRYPFMFSQNQPIHARSLVPCQDSPSVKAPYSAKVQSPYPVLLSAVRTSPPATEPLSVIDGSVKVYKFEQIVPIPSYLLAIAGGELAFASVGERTGVYAEPSLIKRAKWEFEKDLEKFVADAEELTGTAYVWGRYDALILPASFPFGGMENPTVTFLTPALLVGDRSETGVAAHEISHSWCGNLVTNANWDSFWLNEGWTTYLERLLIMRETGKEADRGLEYLIGRTGLLASLKGFVKTPQYQRLHTYYSEGTDPDEGFSSVPYDKGSNFLLFLEQTVGGLDVFMPYARAYIKRFKGMSITTSDWLSHFWEWWGEHHPDLAAKLRTDVDWDAWLYGEGLDLPVKMKYDTQLADDATHLAAKWDKARAVTDEVFGPGDIADFKAKQVQLFLDTLLDFDSFDEASVRKINKTYSFLSSPNPELRYRFFLIALKAGLYADEAAVWVRDQGRMKFCRPLYKAIHGVNPELAIKTFDDYGRAFLHPIARRMVAIDLGQPY